MKTKTNEWEREIENVIESNTDSVIGEDGTIVCDYAQLRNALFGKIKTLLAQQEKRVREEIVNYIDYRWGDNNSSAEDIKKWILRSK